MDCELHEFDWRSHGESNRSFSLERAASSRLDDGSVGRNEAYSGQTRRQGPSALEEIRNRLLLAYSVEKLDSRFSGGGFGGLKPSPD